MGIFDSVFGAETQKPVPRNCGPGFASAAGAGEGAGGDAVCATDLGSGAWAGLSWRGLIIVEGRAAIRWTRPHAGAGEAAADGAAGDGATQTTKSCSCNSSTRPSVMRGASGEAWRALR